MIANIKRFTTNALPRTITTLFLRSGSDYNKNTSLSSPPTQSTEHILIKKHKKQQQQ
jgi:hypothetical protein